MGRIKVLVVDDHYLVRRGLTDTLSEGEGLEVVGEAADGAEAILKAKESNPDVVIMDLNMPNVSGLEAIRQLQALEPRPNILVLTVSEKEEDLFAAMEAGAKGYILKDAVSEELVRAVAHIAGGGVLVSPSVATTLLSQLK
ncbi:MAG: response regulator transcription factor, partial [Chloroflexi bacterium]|nr:response regulator transcription factor [Chloroflexota bacterium]